MKPKNNQPNQKLKWKEVESLQNMILFGGTLPTQNAPDTIGMSGHHHQCERTHTHKHMYYPSLTKGTFSGVPFIHSFTSSPSFMFLVVFFFSFFLLLFITAVNFITASAWLLLWLLLVWWPAGGAVAWCYARCLAVGFYGARWCCGVLLWHCGWSVRCIVRTMLPFLR